MSSLTLQQQELVAIGAALGSNCIPCVKYHIRKGLQAGLTRDMIAEAIEMADAVRQVPARNVREAASSTLGRSGSRCGGRDSACGGESVGAESTGTAGSSCCGPEANS